MALPIVSKVEFNFEVILYITILVFLNDLKSAIRFQSRQIGMLFKAVEGRKNSSPETFERTLHCLIFHSEGTSTLLICVFPIYFKSHAKEVISSFLG